MRAGRPSGTAQGVARCRGAHQLLDNPKVFEDRFALPIVGARDRARMESWLWLYRTAWGRFLRAYLAARSRYAEDKLLLAVERGVRQYVVLGAGLDTFAYRNPFRDLRVFEVDHPSTQVRKRQRLSDECIPIPSSLTFVPVDFERQTMPSALASAGLKSDSPVFFSWLGVMPYLTEEVTLDTFRYVASLPRGSGVAFDYFHPDSASDRWIRRVGFRVAQICMRLAGEPLRVFYEPEQMTTLIHQVGLWQEEDFGHEEINHAYYSGRTDGLCLQRGLGRLSCAWVSDSK